MIPHLPSFAWAGLYRNNQNSSGRLYEELLLERGLYPGKETPDLPDEVDVFGAGDVVEGVLRQSCGSAFVAATT